MRLTDDPLYKLWQSMRRRCRDPKTNSYRYYGAKGITVCERWESFVSFREDMGQRPAGTSLDRIDSAKGYSPDNCRWATIAEQNRNRANTILVEIDGETKTLGAWARERGLKPQTIHCRIHKLGLSPVEALSMPASKKTRHSIDWKSIKARNSRVAAHVEAGEMEAAKGDERG